MGLTRGCSIYEYFVSHLQRTERTQKTAEKESKKSGDTEEEGEVKHNEIFLQLLLVLCLTKQIIYGTFLKDSLWKETRLCIFIQFQGLRLRRYLSTNLRKIKPCNRIKLLLHSWLSTMMYPVSLMPWNTCTSVPETDTPAQAENRTRHRPLRNECDNP